MPDELPATIRRTRTGPPRFVKKVVIVFADGTSELHEFGGDQRCFYKESINDNRAVKRKDQTHWTEHQLWWQSNHHTNHEG